MEKQSQSGHSGMLVSFLNRVKYFLLVYFYIVVVDYGMKQRENTPYYCLLLLLFVLFSFWGQQQLKHLMTFLLYQAAVACGCIVIGRDIQERVLFFLFAALQFGIAFGGAMGERKRVVQNCTATLILLGIPGLLYAYVEKYVLLYEVFLWVAVIFFWLHMWNIHLANRQRFFVEYAQNADSMERGKLLMDGNWVIGSFLSVAAVGIFVGTQVGESEWIERILQLLYRGLQWFFGLLNGGEVEEYISDSVEVPITDSEGAVGEEMVKQNEILRRIMELLGALLMFVLKVLSVLLVFALLAFLVYLIWKSFYKKQPKQVKEYEEVEKIRDNVKTKPKRKREIILFGNANTRVRKLFQRKIEKQEKRGENSKTTKTSAELVDVVVEEARDVVEQMLPLYRKARYSKEKISKEELERYRKL